MASGHDIIRLHYRVEKKKTGRNWWRRIYRKFLGGEKLEIEIEKGGGEGNLPAREKSKGKAVGPVET